MWGASVCPNGCAMAQDAGDAGRCRRGAKGSTFLPSVCYMFEQSEQSTPSGLLASAGEAARPAQSARTERTDARYGLARQAPAREANAGLRRCGQSEVG